MGLKPGTVKSTPELSEVYDEAVREVSEEMEQEQAEGFKQAERDAVLQCFMGAQNLIGMDVATAQAALIAAGQGMRRLPRRARLLRRPSRAALRLRLRRPAGRFRRHPTVFGSRSDDGRMRK